MLKKQNRDSFRKVRVLFGVTALFLLLISITVQAAEAKEITPKYLANKEEWEGKTGYHLGKAAQTKSCGHEADDRYVVAISINGSILTPNKTYLKGNFKTKGAMSKIPKKYKDQISENKIYFETANVTGINSHMVSNQVAKLKVNGKEIVLAAPYLCPDGYAGYSYFRYYFSYCPNTGEIYYTGTSEHVWLACTKGDLGVNEYHPNAYSHKIYKYYIEPNEYNIAYNGNGSTSGSTSSQKATYDESLKLRNNGFKRTGYTFVEWNTKKDGSGKTYSPGKSVKNLTAKDGGTVTLYAQWKKGNYTIAYNGNGATSGSTANQTAVYNTALNLRNNGYTKTGYIFTGWNTKGNGTGTAYKAGQSVKNLTTTTGGTVTLYAQWKANTYIIAYNGNGHTSGNIASQSAVYDVALNLKTNGYVKTGYTFTGWNTKSNGTGVAYKAGQSVKNLIPTAGGTVTLYAQWKADTYLIAFDGNGATEGSMDSITATPGIPILLPGNAFKRTTEQGESLFLGWALTAEPEGRAIAFTDQATVSENLAQNPGETVTLYAIWDDCPSIEASDRYFNLWWAQNGRITEEELLQTASAVDKEDNQLENRTKAQIEAVGFPGSLSLLDYEMDKFTSITENGTVDITYQAVDSAGHTVYETVQVHIYDTAAVPMPEKYTRYIIKKYYDKSYEEGGLHPDSIWRTDPEYKKALEDALDNETPVASYYFTRDEIVEAQDYITEHGIGDTKEPNALQHFFNRFMR